MCTARNAHVVNILGINLLQGLTVDDASIKVQRNPTINVDVGKTVAHIIRENHMEKTVTQRVRDQRIFRLICST